MKSLVASIFVVLVAPWAYAVEIVMAEYDSTTKSLTLELAFAGGHQDHQFSLQWDTCQERAGVKEIAARLMDSGHNDAGRNELFQTVNFNLSSLACRPSWLTIRSGRFSHKTLWIE
ncbi:MAG: hypothetical protein ACK5V3_01910 [Bdellovibrionales bacterium]